jgi:hypothetical protein
VIGIIAPLMKRVNTKTTTSMSVNVTDLRHRDDAALCVAEYGFAAKFETGQIQTPAEWCSRLPEVNPSGKVWVHGRLYFPICGRNFGGKSETAIAMRDRRAIPHIR